MPSVPKHRRVLGENIRARRKQMHLSQEKLAELAALHPVYLGNLERGQENVSVDALVRIAKALKISVQELATGI